MPAIRLIAWNVNHRTRAKPIPDQLPSAILALAPDVVVLTEYVESSGHERLLVALGQGGLEHSAVTARQAGFNQVLVASRWPARPGDALPPLPDAHATTNFLHLAFLEHSFDVVGVRAPAYRGAKQRAYWTGMADWLGDAHGRRTIVLGDLNADPDRKGAAGESLRGLTTRGWRLADPAGDWSYWCPRSSSRIDHALVSPTLTIRDARYVVAEAAHVFAGSGAMSDHAVLLVDVDVAAVGAS